MSKTHLFDLDGKIAFVSGASRGTQVLPAREAGAEVSLA
ncbi:short-chain dehydrogenase, partial [Pseudomonas aeruginosa]